MQAFRVSRLSILSDRANVGDKTVGARPEEAGRRAARLPCNREKYSEFLSIRPIRGKTVPESPTIRAGSRKIPYSGEQGHFSIEQGIQIP